MPDETGTTPLKVLLDRCAQYLADADIELIRAAYAVAAAAHAGVCRRSGEPYIEHPLAVAHILAELALDAQTIAAALLHDTVEDTSLTLAEVAERFGPAIASVVDGVTKFAAVEAVAARAADAPFAASADDPQDRHGIATRNDLQRAETVRKLFTAMSADPRVMLVKLADRLHNMRTLAAMAAPQQQRIARETLDIYAPLAGRIGLYAFKSELEDLAFSFLNPQEFALIARRLRDEAAHRTPWAERVAERLRQQLLADGIHATVQWRVKRAYRAWVDASEGGMDVSQLHDVIAFRVLVDSRSECYRALGVINLLWPPLSDRVRDYISRPKLNGYQSLHTAVFALDGRLAQIHIRTHAMHRAAQHGLATAWLDRAERGTRADGAATSWPGKRPAWVAQYSDWQHDEPMSATEFLATVRAELLESQVFVSTPKGDVHELPVGATALDFAYKIHSAIGDHCAGAQVLTAGKDGALVPQRVPREYVLRGGDIVQIERDPAISPQPEWLSLIVTRHARGGILRALRRAAHPDRADPAHELEATAETPPALTGPPRHPNGKPAMVRLARCCYPCPGDTIQGLAGRGRQVVAHRTCCRTVRAALARRRARGGSYAEPVRLTWEHVQPIAYRLHLAIYGQDHRGLMYEVSDCLARMKLNLVGSAASANRDRYKAAITLTIEMPPDVRRDAVLQRLRAVPGVLRVERALGKGCDENQP